MAVLHTTSTENENVHPSSEGFTAHDHDELSHQTTSQKELWSYYIYYIGNNGLSGFNFGPSQFQNLLFLAGYDPTAPPFSTPCGPSNGCVLPYLGRVRDSKFIQYHSCHCHLVLDCSKLHRSPYQWYKFRYSSIVVTCYRSMGGLWQLEVSFSCSVYSNFGPIIYVLSRPNITIFFTLVAVGVSFAWLGVDTPDQWRAGIALYILGCKHSREHRSYHRLTLYSDIVPGMSPARLSCCF